MPPTVETRFGTLTGLQHAHHQSYLGIPFAAPPVGELRFAAPVEPEAWSGVREAVAYGPSAHQPKSALPGMRVGEQSEDCLTLNVFTPAADDGRRPVMVWIHGGGFTTGGACQDLYRGGPLVERGDVVLVTINYRLGLFGYLDLPELEGSTANAGQLDQIAALEWVRDHIARFGGDPGNVTIFGESAGAMAVCTLLAMPAAGGLFHKAIAQSGAANTCHDRASAAEVADAWLRHAGTSREKARDLRRIAPERLIEIQVAAEADLRAARRFLSSSPVVDGESLPEHPLAAAWAGRTADVPLLIGTTRDEWRLFEMPSLMRDLDCDALEARVGRLLREPSEAAALIDVYAHARGWDPARSDEAKWIYSAIQTDRTFRIPAIRMAEAHANHAADTFMYLFSWSSPARRGELGACHAIELPFVFGTLDAPGMDRFSGAGPEAERLAGRMMDAWIAFARSGRPSHAELPDWPRYETAQRATLQLDAAPEVLTAPMEAERDAWEALRA